MIEACNGRIDGHPDVKGPATSEPMFVSQTRLKHLVSVELQQLKMFQQQAGHRDFSIVGRF